MASKYYKHTQKYDRIDYIHVHLKNTFSFEVRYFKWLRRADHWDFK